ncbi:MAG: hypothetical protein ACYCUM_01825 [Solirubrobacteraceae bacterium]
MERVRRARRGSAEQITRSVALPARTPRRRARPVALRLARSLLTSALALALLCCAAPLSALASSALRLRATDRASLRYISASGSLLYETGRANGTLPGWMRVHMRIESTFTGSFAIHVRGGTIIGHGWATPHGSGVYESFAGTLLVTGGTGRYRHAHGRAGLYGTFDRNNYDLTIKTAGTLLY